MNIVLISTYELGRQPFGLSSPAAWLRAVGYHVSCFDLSRELLDEAAVSSAQMIALYVPMHTATRLAAELIVPLRQLNSLAHLCFYGLYAPVNEEYLRGLGVGTILGGEFEEGLVSLATRLAAATPARPGAAPQIEPVISLARQKFAVPDRTGMPALEMYAHVMMPNGERRIAGSTEATRGCKHLCKHCPIVPVYNGAFRIVDRDVVLADIRQQVSAGAQHITFGDPDFFNGPAHSLAIVNAMHREFPQLSYDVTIKIEHLRDRDLHLQMLRDTGCLFVISAVESVDNSVLEKFDKGHTRADFLAVAARFRELDMTLLPTFVPFTPWTSLENYADLLDTIGELGLTENVAPVQLAIRLLIPAGSRLLELPDVRAIVGPFDSSALVFPWKHADPRVEALCAEISLLVQRGEKMKLSRTQIFMHIRRTVRTIAEKSGCALPSAQWNAAASDSPRPVPYLDEPWYCCAEPTSDQFISIGAPGEVGKPERRPDQYV